MTYNPQAVNQAIASSNRAGQRIGGREAKLIHALLKGRKNDQISHHNPYPPVHSYERSC